MSRRGGDVQIVFGTELQNSLEAARMRCPCLPPSCLVPEPPLPAHRARPLTSTCRVNVSLVYLSNEDVHLLLTYVSIMPLLSKKSANSSIYDGACRFRWFWETKNRRLIRIATENSSTRRWDLTCRGWSSCEVSAPGVSPIMWRSVVACISAPVEGWKLPVRIFPAKFLAE